MRRDGGDHRAPRAPRRRDRRPPRASVRLRALLSLGVVAVLGCGGTFAYWSDSATVTGATFTSGVLDLEVNGADEVSDFTVLDLAAMVPGNSTAGLLRISNSGTVPLTYTLAGSGTDADGKGLSAALTAKVTADTAVTGAAPSAGCAGAALAGSGASFTGALVPAGSARTLAVGASETLCVEATLPIAAPTSLQGATTDVTLTVSAEQVR